jgi:hypothetical protein
MADSGRHPREPSLEHGEVSAWHEPARRWGGDRTPSPKLLRLGGIILGVVINAGARFPLMGHTYGDGPGTRAPMAIIGGEADPVHPATAAPGALRPQQHLAFLEHRIGTGIAISLPLDRFILPHPGHGEGELVVIRITYPPQGSRPPVCGPVATGGPG